MLCFQDFTPYPVIDKEECKSKLLQKQLHSARNGWVSEKAKLAKILKLGRASMLQDVTQEGEDGDKFNTLGLKVSGNRKGGKRSQERRTEKAREKDGSKKRIKQTKYLWLSASSTQLKSLTCSPLVVATENATLCSVGWRW